MKKIIYVVVLLVLIYFGYKYFIGNNKTTKPDVVVVEKMLKDFLIERTKSKCKGVVNLEYLRDVSIGNYKPNYLGGNEGVWPVYGYYELTCKEGSNIKTFKDLNEGNTKVSITFIHKNTFGKPEFFEPKVISEFFK